MPKSVHLLQICFMGFMSSVLHMVVVRNAIVMRKVRMKFIYIYIYIYPCAAEHKFAAFCVRVQYVNTLNLFFNVMLNKTF
jgi:hypothetical protein